MPKELKFHTLETLSNKSGIPTEELWLHAEAGDLILSFEIKEESILFSKHGFYQHEIEKGLPKGEEFYLEEKYSGYLQLRTATVRRLKKRPIVRDKRFHADKPNYPFAQYTLSGAAEIDKRNLVILAKHVQDFLEEPNSSSKQVEKLSKSFWEEKLPKTNTELNAFIKECYIEVRVKFNSKRRPDQILNRIKEKAKENVRVLDKGLSIKTEKREHRVTFKRFKNYICELNKHCEVILSEHRNPE